MPLVHGGAYFARLIEAVEEAREGDAIYFTDWRGDPDQLLALTGPRSADCWAGPPAAAWRCAGCSGGPTAT